MTYLQESNLTVTLASVNGGAVGGASSAGYGKGTATTHINGFIESIYVKVDAACGTTSYVLVTTSSTSKVIFRINDPSSGGGTYYPRHTGNHSTSTGGALCSSHADKNICLRNERITAVVQTSSAVKFLGAVATIKAIWS